ncbi:hypothetical protein [Parabacteroides sp.]
MTSMELNATLLKELSTIISDENMVKDVISYIRNLRRSSNVNKTKAKIEPYSIEELNERIDQAEKNYAEGRYTDSQQVHQEITNLLSSL